MTTAVDICTGGSVCGGTGFVHIDGTRQARECACRISQRPLLCREKAGIPKAYLDATFSNYEPEKKMPEQAVALKSLMAFVKNWPEHLEAGDCISILSPITRIGKSHLAIATGRGIIDRYQESVEQDLVMFLNISNWVQSWKDYWIRWPVSMDDKKKYADQAWNEATAQLSNRMQRMKSVSLLILDDLGEVRPESGVLNRLYDLVEHRTSQNLPIIVTANHLWDAIIRRYGDESRRIVDRLRERSVGHTFIIEAVAKKKAARRKGGRK